MSWRVLLLITGEIEERQYTLEVLQLTSKLLKENPEYYTIWNVRRRLLIHGLFSKSSDLSSPSKELPNSSQTSVYTTSGEDSSLCCNVFRGLEKDPGRPEPPESWEEWYNS
jgi:hypothetical protein